MFKKNRKVYYKNNYGLTPGCASYQKMRKLLSVHFGKIEDKSSQDQEANRNIDRKLSLLAGDSRYADEFSRNTHEI
uniref:Uncharacterized protein n=1 Tax=Glossina pallidipes TaxID=7398 RepID=A0A1B0ACF4_GLOPL